MSLRRMETMSREPCRGCGSTVWSRMLTRFPVGEPVRETCDRCDSHTSSTLHDVYFDKPGDHHGITDPETGKPIFISSKTHKALEMKRLGLREAGDRVRGSRNFDPISYRHAMESLRKTGGQHGTEQR